MLPRVKTLQSLCVIVIMHPFRPIFPSKHKFAGNYAKRRCPDEANITSLIRKDSLNLNRIRMVDWLVFLN